MLQIVKLVGFYFCLFFASIDCAVNRLSSNLNLNPERSVRLNMSVSDSFNHIHQVTPTSGPWGARSGQERTWSLALGSFWASGTGTDRYTSFKKQVYG